MRPVYKKKFTAFDAMCAAAVLAAGILTHSLTCRTMSRQMIQAVLRIREVSAQVEDIGNLRGTLANGELHITRFTSRLGRLHKRIPDELNTDRFLKEIVETAEANNVLILRVQPGETGEQGSYRDIPVDIEAKADFRSVYSFITAIREMPRLVTLEEVRMSAGEDDEAQVSFILRIYAYKETADEQEA